MFSMAKQKFIGRVLWWDVRDERGILKDSQSRRFYFDLSCINGDENIRPGALVAFEICTTVKNFPCASKVELVATKSISKSKDKNLRDQLRILNEEK